MAADSASIISIALQLLAGKVLLLLTLGITAGLFSWAMWYHSWIPLVIAIAFAVLVFLPVLLRGGDHNGKDSS